MRLQGPAYHQIKHEYRIISYSVSLEGRIRVELKHKQTRKWAFHWLSPDEQAVFDVNAYRKTKFKKRKLVNQNADTKMDRTS